MEKVHSFFKNQKRIFVHIINNLFFSKRTYIPVFCLQKEDNEFYRIVNTNRNILVIKDKRETKNIDIDVWEMALRKIKELLEFEDTERYKMIDSWITNYEYFLFFGIIKVFIDKNIILRKDITYFSIFSYLIEQTYLRVYKSGRKSLFIKDFIESIYLLEEKFPYVSTEVLKNNIEKSILKQKEESRGINVIIFKR